MWLRLCFSLLCLICLCSADDSCYQIEILGRELYKEKKVNILYDVQYKHLARQIECSLNSLKVASIHLISLEKGQKINQVCGNSTFRSLLDPIHLTVTITEAIWLEEMCTHDAAVLHMKKTARFGNRWVAHILTLRTDMIIPLTYEHKAIDDKHLALIMEAIAFAWRPTLYVHGGQPYKAFRFDTFIKKVVKERIYLMPTIAVLMVFCVAVVCAGTYCARRSKENAERRAIQNQRAELLSDWGQPPDSQVSDIIEQDWSRRTSITSGELAVSSNQGFDGNERSKDVVRSTGQDTRKSLREALDMM